MTNDRNPNSGSPKSAAHGKTNTEGGNRFVPPSFGSSAKATVPNDTEYFRSLYDDTMSFFTQHGAASPIFPAAARMVQAGSTEVKVSRRYLLKAIDETWVKAIEDAMLSLDSAIRKPSRFLEEVEEVLPIELSSSITSRSIMDLAMHAEYINDVTDDGMVVPSKILNTFNEETLNTYENRFLNTLVHNLYDFVEKRYRQAKEHGQDEKVTEVSVKSEFKDGKITGKLKINLEMSEPPEEGEVVGRKFHFSADLWKRVEKIHEMVSGYMGTAFIKEMGRQFVRPPIMRTNAINKNRDMQQCLILWEFIESYEKVGYDMLADEKLETLSDDYLSELQSTLALQYMIFRYKMNHCIDPQEALAYAESDILSPDFVTTPQDFASEDYNVYDSYYRRLVPVSQLRGARHLSDDEWRIRQAVDLALAAEQVQKQQRANRTAASAEKKAARLTRRSEREEKKQLQEEAALTKKAVVAAEKKAKRALKDAEAHRLAAAEAQEQAAAEEIAGKREAAQARADAEREAAAQAEAERLEADAEAAAALLGQNYGKLTEEDDPDLPEDAEGDDPSEE